MEIENVKIVVYVPSSHADEVRKVLAESGTGHVGNYDSCTFSIKGTGRFRGLEGTKPFVGESGQLEEVEEERIETICPWGQFEAVLEAVKKAHPYEEPAIDVFPLLN